MTPTAFSYVSGVSAEPLLGSTIGQQLDEAAARWPERPALISPSHGVAWTWKELRARTSDLAAGLLALGLRRGERIGVWSLNRPEWTLTQFAAAEAGLVFVTINPAYRLHELEYALRKVGCAALVVATRFKTSDFIGMVNALAPELASAKPGALKAQKLPDLRIVAQIGESAAGTLAFEEVARLGGAGERAALEAMRDQIQFDDAANIQFTSGTTGSPKGVTLSHHNILNNGYFTGRAMRLTPEDRICIPVPLYHCFGMVMGNLAAVTLGAAMVYPGEGFDPLATLKTVESQRCTALYGVPTMFIAELDHPEFGSFDLSSLRTGIMAGAPCPIAVMQKVIERMHMRDVTIAYGMTETSPVSFQSSTEDTIERRVYSAIFERLRERAFFPAGQADQPLAEFRHLLRVHASLALGRAQFHAGDQPAKILVAGARFHQQDIAPAAHAFFRVGFHGGHLRADVCFHTRFHACQMKARRAINSVTIEQRHCGHAMLRTHGNQLFRIRRAFQKTKRRPRMQFAIHQSYIPRANQPCRTTSK